MATVEEILMVKGPDVIVAAPDNTVEEAARMMGQANVGSVVIKDGDNVAGIFTERDLLKRVIGKGKDPKVIKLCEVMSSPVKSCRLNDDIQVCAREMTEAHIRHMAIIEDNALVGLIGLRDVMAAQLKEEQKRVQELEQQVD